MRKEDLIPVIARHDPILADAVSRMVDYIQDRWAAPYPSKEQTEAVNAYLRSIHADGGGTMSETDIAHRRIATQKITINAIRAGCAEPHSGGQGVLHARTAARHGQVADRCNT